MKFSITSAMAILAMTATALPSSVHESPEFVARSMLENRDTECTVAATDRLLFSVTIKTFLGARKARDPSKCNWDSDGCTSGLDRPLGFNFLPSCQHHDFGFTNARAQKRLNDSMKKRLDDNFKKDLYKHCSQFNNWYNSWKGPQCRGLADIYYLAVRGHSIFGFGKRDGGIMDLDDKPAEIVERAEPPVDGDPDIPDRRIPEVLPNDSEDIPKAE